MEGSFISNASFRELFPHQKSAIERASRVPRSLIIRALGSGKTAIALHVADRVLVERQKLGLMICPAHLIPQTLKERDRWPLRVSIRVVDSNPEGKFAPGYLYLMSFDRARLAASTLTRQNWQVVLVDEIQHAKNPATFNYQVLSSLRERTEYFIGLTGAPFQNSPREFFSLCTLIAGQSLSIKELEACLEYKWEEKLSWFRYVLVKVFGVRRKHGPVVGVKYPERLRSLLRPYVDFVPEETYLQQCGVPSVQHTVSSIEMTQEELQSYLVLLRRHRKRRERAFLADHLDDESIQGTYKKLADLRQNLLGTLERPGNKVLALCQAVQEVLTSPEKCKILIFSNFVKLGVQIISSVLQARNVPHICYTGGLPRAQKDRIVSEFITGKVPVLVVSPVGFEGLDLRDTTHVFIADPHFNPEVTAQLIARATRAGGNLSCVQVYHFLATSRHLKQGTVDEAIWRIAERKRHVNTLLREALFSIPHENIT